MEPIAFKQLADRYARLRVAVVGDYCLDQYLEIDPDHTEISIETNLPVHNVRRVRSQAGAAGTILNNLVALGIGTLHAIGFCGEDGEGYELRRALEQADSVNLDRFIQTPDRHTFVYRKPLIMHADRAAEELSRLDRKNVRPTPESLRHRLATSLNEVAPEVDAIILMDQVDHPNTGVVTDPVKQAAHHAARQREALPVLADSRLGLGAYPPMGFKMNLHEFKTIAGIRSGPPVATVRDHAAALAKKNGQPVFVTMAEHGIVGALANGRVAHVPAHPVHGPIDIVGAGDSVTANLTAALAAGADLTQAMQIAMAAASLVIHQLGTTGTASPEQIAQKLENG